MTIRFPIARISTTFFPNNYLLMEGSSIPFTRRCRACLEWIDEKRSVDLTIPILECTSEEIFEKLFHSASKTMSLLEVFNECTQLNARWDHSSEGDDRHDWRYICIPCCYDLQRAYQFILKARVNNAKLYELSGHKKKYIDVDKAIADEVETIETLNENLEQRVTENYLEATRTSESPLVLQVEKALDEIFGSDSCDEERNKSPITFLELDFKEELKGHEEKALHSTFEEIQFTTTFQENKNPTPIQIVPVNNELSQLTGSDDDDNSSIEVRLISAPNEKDKKQNLDFKCELCTAKFDFQRDLMQHYEDDHDERDLHFPCNSCEHRFFSKSSLNTHIREIHQNCEYLDCLQCGRAVLKSFFKTHQRRHFKKTKFLCSECPNTFTSSYTLKKHLRIHSKNRDRNIECELCGRRFYTIESFRMHQVIHQDPTERESYNCSLCDKSFLRQTNLKLHMRMHRGETVGCPHCGKQFVRRKDLEIHIRFHTGEFPYPCKTCNKRFAIKGHLNAHEKKHEGVKYRCSLCGKEFINEAGLRQHSYEHTGMPLFCDICKKGFPTKFKVRRHIQSVHQNLFTDGSREQDAEQYIKHLRKVESNRISSPARPTHCTTIEYDKKYEMEILEEDADNIVNFLIEEI